jgi:hypothetical protein
MNYCTWCNGYGSSLKALRGSTAAPAVADQVSKELPPRRTTKNALAFSIMSVTSADPIRSNAPCATATGEVACQHDQPGSRQNLPTACGLAAYSTAVTVRRLGLVDNRQSFR